MAHLYAMCSDRLIIITFEILGIGFVEIRIPTTQFLRRAASTALCRLRGRYPFFSTKPRITRILCYRALGNRNRKMRETPQLRLALSSYAFSIQFGNKTQKFIFAPKTNFYILLPHKAYALFIDRPYRRSGAWRIYLQ